MVPYLGDFAEDETVYVWFNTFDSNDPSQSVTATDLADADIKVYKDGSITQIVTDGATVTVNHDTTELGDGVHLITINTAIHADYSTGSDYAVRIEGVTVDAGTINAVVATFSIENRSITPTQIAALQTDLDTLTAGVTLAAGAITDASLAGNMEIVFETDFATNYNQTDNAWVTNGTSFIGTGWNVAKTGYALTAVTGLGAQTANLTGNLSGSVGSVTGAVGSVTGAVASVTNGVTLANGAITDVSLAGGLETVYETDFATNYNATRLGWATNVQDTLGTGNLPADAVTISGDATTADNLQTLFNGNEGFYGAYAGPRGAGVYLNDAAANTSTANGVDGTIGNPVSTIGAAKTIADSMSLDRVYLVNDSAITLGATMEDYEFVGLGSPSSNSIALNSIDVDQSGFYNLTISGIQGGSLSAKYEDCIIGTATIYPHALRCGFSDSVTGTTFSSNDNVILDSCFSQVAGNATPIFICSGANLDVSFRHYSGGIEIKSSHATATISIEADGQVIFNADCSTSTAVTMRGMLTVTDNTGGMSALTDRAVWETILDDGTTTYDRTTDSLQENRDQALTIKTETDKFVFTKANELDVNTKSINDAEVIGDGNATPWDGV